MNGPERTILLVDDSDHLLVTLGDALGFEGYRVIQAHDGEQALKRLQTVTPDLILLDIMMPVMGGGKVADRIRADPRWKGIPVVFLTAMPEHEMQQRESMAGLRPYISKLIPPDRVLDEIRRYLPAPP